MATLARLQLLIAADDQATSTIQSTAATLDSLGSRVQALGTNLLRVGGMMTAGVTVPMAALGVAAGRAASDLNEAANKVQVVFGPATDTIRQFAETSAQNLGISQRAALEATGTFGNMFTAMGLGQTKAADLSMQIVTLASDLASFNNVDPTVALEALRSGLVGETEPLRQFGVNLDAAAIKAEALRLGLIAQGQELDAAARAQAALSLVMQQTTNAQGDFARTADSAANAQRIARAEMENAAATLGTSLAPVMGRVAQVVADLAQRFTALPSGVQTSIVVMGALVAAIGPVLTSVGTMLTVLPQLGTAFTALTGPVGLVVAAMAGLMLAYQTNFLGFRDGVHAGIEFLKSKWPELQAAIETAVQAIQTVLGQLASAFQTHKATIDAALAALSAVFTTVWPVLAQTVRDQLQGIQTAFSGLTTALAGMATTVSGIVALIKAIFTGDFGAAKDAVIEIISGLRTTVEGIIMILKGSMQVQTAAIKNLAVAAFTGLKDEAITLVTGLKTGVIDAINGLLGTAVTLVTGLKTLALAQFTELKTNAVATITGLKDDIIAKLNELLGSAGALAMQIGTAIGQGILNGLESMREAVMAKAGEIVDSAVNWMKDKLKVWSPSRVTMELGRLTGLGFAEGLGRQVGAVAASADRLVGVVTAMSPRLAAGVDADGALRMTVAPRIDWDAIGLERRRETRSVAFYGPVHIHANNPGEFYDQIASWESTRARR